MKRIFDFSTFAGISLALILVIFAIISGGAEIIAYLDLPSALIVIGGTVFISIASFSFGDFFRTLSVIFETFFSIKENRKKIAEKCIKLSEVSRRDGILSLQKLESSFPDSSFFKKYLNIAVDGMPANDVKIFMNQEIESIHLRHLRSIEIIRKAAETAPAMGLVGTLIGLVQMLGKLEDPSKIGPAMALALLTTLYGAMLTYLFLIPLANKLERNSEDEISFLEFLSDAVYAIASRDGPVKLEVRLNTILSPEERLKINT